MADDKLNKPFTAILMVLILVMAIMATRYDMHGRSRGNRMNSLPKLFLWAWERPEELSSIDPKKVGVAYLARTLYLRGGEVALRPRLQPLKVPAGTALIAVVRIESDRYARPELSAGQRAETVTRIAELTGMGAAAIQIDFDAVESERAFYRELILDLRRRLPNDMGLSMTALASWCISDDWISDLPVDEAVPMLFRMGVDEKQVLMYLESGKDFQEPLCRRSIGISEDEPIPNLPVQRRIYLFRTTKTQRHKDSL
jgi:hypothetical protein